MAGVTVIGLDGVNWRVLRHAMDKGLMPNLESILEDSYRAELETTYPSVTGPAWTSIVTGDNPGSHGVYDFVDHIRRKPYSSLDIHSETIHEKIAGQGGEVSLVNLPLSYPPDFEGDFVGSFLAPEDDFVRPHSLESRFDFSDYKKSLTAFEKGYSVIESSLEAARDKAELLDSILADQDFFFLLFSAPDWIMHNYYHEMRKGEKDRGFQVFRLIDESIGRAIRRSENIILLSDHGFETFDEVFHVNQWLEDEGFLETEGSMEADFSDNRIIDLGLKFCTSTEFLRRLSIGAFELLENYIPAPENHKVGVRVEMSKGIDRERSVAFCPSSGIRGIYINDERFDSVVDDREAAVEDIMGRLPEDVKARKREEVYEGDRISEAPDIVFEERNYRVLRTMYGKKFSKRRINHHGRKGFLVAWGDSFSSSKGVRENNLYDVAPTIAESLGLEFESDGSPIDGVFEGEGISGSDIPEEF